MYYDLIIENGIIVTENNCTESNLAVKDGKISAFFTKGTKMEAKKIINAEGKYIFPGLIDVHVHAGHGEPDRETFYNASMAAAAGGITTIFEQPLSKPITVKMKDLKNKRKEAEKNCVVDFALWGGLVPNQFNDIENFYNAGSQAFKSFMCRSSNYPMTNDGILLKGMKWIGEIGGLVAVHAENDELIFQLSRDFLALGKDDIESFLKSHPVYSELEAIERFIFLAKQAPKCKVHIVHMSIPQGAELIKIAKSQRVDITVETAPQYLGLSTEDLIEKKGLAKCDPPVRDKELVDKLWEYVIDGTIDIVASDHSPHPFEKKVVPMDKFSMASEGVTGLQTLLPVLITEGIHKRNMSLNRLVQITASNPAKRFGVYPKKGTLSIGSDADFVIIDLDKEWVCNAKDMFYINKHTPFDGKVFKGSVEKTYVRGNVVYENSIIKVEPGYGMFVEMNMEKG